MKRNSMKKDINRFSIVDNPMTRGVHFIDGLSYRLFGARDVTYPNRCFFTREGGFLFYLVTINIFTQFVIIKRRKFL